MRPSLILPVVVLTAAVSFAPALAQDAGTSSGSAAGPGSLGTVVRGNTIIVFEPAQLSDSDAAMYRVWDQFVAEHPGVARELGKRPSLLKNDDYMRRHPELAKLFSDHPELKQAMIENPRDFVH